MRFDVRDNRRLQRAHRRIRDGDAHRTDLRVRASGIHAIREEHDVQVMLRSDPEGRASESGVSERWTPYEMTGRAVRARRVPPERAAGESRIRDGGELRDGGGFRQAATAEGAPFEIGASETIEIVRRAEQPCMTGHLAKRVGI